MYIYQGNTKELRKFNKNERHLIYIHLVFNMSDYIYYMLYKIDGMLETKREGVIYNAKHKDELRSIFTKIILLISDTSGIHKIK